MMRRTEPEVTLDDVEFNLYVSGGAIDVTGLTLTPTRPIGVVPKIGEEVTITFRVSAVRREERE